MNSERKLKINSKKNKINIANLNDLKYIYLGLPWYPESNVHQ